MLECLKNCWKNVSEHAKIYWKHVLECLKIIFEKAEKSWKKLKKYQKKFGCWNFFDKMSYRIITTWKN